MLVSAIVTNKNITPLITLSAFGGTISSYTWICMIISFLQRRNPPIIPSLQKMPDDKRSTVDGKLSPFADDLESIRGCGKDNKESLAELLFAFFLHYGYEFNYATYVVSVKEGRLLSRREKGWDNYADNKEARCRLCVEEPFNTERNLGNSADDYAWHGIHEEIRRAYEFLADGCQLEKCCEQFEFPPDPEKTPFQRPPPKPKPTLTRSASQTGARQNQEPNSGGRKKGGNRNQSAQRSGNRRASSGSAFNNQRGVYMQSPPVGVTAMDYFAAKGNLHDQLFQQYQYLQAQQDVLRSQLAAQQHTNQGQVRAGDLAGVGSPHPRSQFANGSVGNSRYNSIDVVPQTAPLLPGYMLHYPPRFAPPSAAQGQKLTREGTNTNPSSPSLVAAVPALRRQGQRASEPVPSTSSMRSQSQPGRSFPHPLLVHQLAQQGFDMQALGVGAGYPNLRSPQAFGHAQHAGVQMPYSAMPNMQHSNTDTAMPKEYVGYYVGQSPQLGPQQATANQMPVPAMPQLRDPPQRQRRVTPDLMPPTANGRHSSRSPSPLSHSRASAVGDIGTSRAQGNAFSSSSYDSSPAPELASAGEGGPIIVNGSNPPPQPRHAINGISNMDSPYSYSLPLRTKDFSSQEADAQAERRSPSPGVSPTTRRTSGPRAPATSNGHASSHDESAADSLPTSAAPLLSPVAELRTPSPTKTFDTFDSPQQSQVNGLVKAAKVANAKQAQRDENDKPRTNEAKNERNKAGLGIGNGTKQGPAKSSGQQASNNGNAGSGQRNEWQPAPGRKSHKKNKSTAAGGGGQPRSPRAHGGGGGEPMPANENERKGG